MFIRRCTKCIFPESVPGIEFDSNGACNFCNEFIKEKNKHSEFELIEKFSNAKRKNVKYDCIVPLSGGRDSSYVLYLAKDVYKLNVLAVNYNNEFQTDCAKKNIENAVKALDVDLVSIKSKKNIAHKIVKYKFLSCDEYKQYCVCRACSYGIKSIPYREAIRRKIPLILWGDSNNEKTTDIMSKVNKSVNMPNRRSKLSNLNYYIYELNFLLQRLEFPVDGNYFFERRTPKLFNKDIENVHIFNYIPWDRKIIKQVITNRLNWQMPKDSATSWRTDCKLTPLINYYYLKTYGCTKACFGYHKMINYGQITREEALYQEINIIKNLTTEFIRKIVTDEIGIKREKAENIIQ